MCMHASMNNLMRSSRTLINGCYHPTRCSGISKGQFSFMPLGLAKLGEEEVGGGGFSMLKRTLA